MKVLVCAEAHSGEVVALWIGTDEEAARDQMGSADRVLAATDPRFDPPLPISTQRSFTVRSTPKSRTLRSLATRPREWTSGPKQRPALASRWPPMS
jgi:hypothetical protein